MKTNIFEEESNIDRFKEISRKITEINGSWNPEIKEVWDDNWNRINSEYDTPLTPSGYVESFK